MSRAAKYSLVLKGGRLIDERNNTRVWSDPRVQSYYWSQHGRSATMNPLPGPQMWALLRKPEFEHLYIA